MRVGIIGGSFDPVHLGHTKLADHFFKKLQFDKMFVIPAGTPPHKLLDKDVDDIDRYNMCLLAFSGENYEVLGTELFHRGKCYTVDTLEKLKAPGQEMFFIMGGDMFMTLLEWRNCDRIFKLAQICASPRGDVKKDDMLEFAKELEKRGAKTHISKAAIPDVSSTIIRERLRNNESIKGSVPQLVEKYILRKNLYKNR